MGSDAQLASGFSGGMSGDFFWVGMSAVIEISGSMLCSGENLPGRYFFKREIPRVID